MKEVIIPLSTRYSRESIYRAGELFLLHCNSRNQKIRTPYKCYVYQKADTAQSVVYMGAKDVARLGKVIGEFECQAIEYYTEARLFGILKYSRCRMLCSTFILYDNPKDLIEFGLKREPKKTKVLKRRGK